MLSSLYRTVMAAGGWGPAPYSEVGDFSRHATKVFDADVAHGVGAVTLTFDIAYQPGDQDHHRLNVYAPTLAQDQGSALCPVVLHVHGGGWKRGSRGKAFYGAPYMGLEYARHGCVSVVPSYRLGTAHPAHVDDICSVVRWIHQHVQQFHGDPANIFLSGHSAGAHLVSLLITDPTHAVRNQVARQLQDVKGVVAISGVYTLAHPFHKDAAESDASWQHALYKRMYIHSTFGSDPDQQQLASPTHHVEAARTSASTTHWPPFLVVNADSDLGLEVDGARFHSLLVSAGVPAERLVVPNKSHATITKCQETVLAAVDFVRRHGRPTASSDLDSPHQASSAAAAAAAAADCEV